MHVKHLAAVAAALTLLAACDHKKADSTSAPASSASPTLTPPATPIKAGQPLAVAWTGPNGANDYIDVVTSGRAKQIGDEISYAKTSAGNPAKLTAPGEPGAYDVRYVQDHGDRTVIAHVPIQVVK